MASIPLLRLLLLLLPLPLQEHLWPSHHRPNDAGVGAGELHPIFVGWFGLWENSSDLSAHHYNECFKEQMSLVYDPVANDYRNFPGIETRVANFGIVRGFR
uniref:Uncharacterized protein n=1 Tax=Oryza sativa subsp. japonica TaxID=39947 RepID=Q6YY86_ORYSJ|nr:hypothetical protein [Oryza sativa Japonica Group]